MPSQFENVFRRCVALERLAAKLLLLTLRMNQYSADLRERLVGTIDIGLAQAEAARRFGACPSMIEPGSPWRLGTSCAILVSPAP
jgi:hypothetical protein